MTAIRKSIVSLGATRLNRINASRTPLIVLKSGRSVPGHARPFSQISKWSIAVSEMTKQDFQSLKVDRTRLMTDLHHTCQWGTGKRYGDGPTETGMSRLTLSDSDKEARDWFVATTKKLGCNVTIDKMGNIFAVRPGLDTSEPATFAGSHLDTQPTGGRYDGILGIHAGIEMLKVLNDNWVETAYSVGVVNWTNEEGARFPLSMVSSAVWAEDYPLSDAHNLKEVGGGSATMKSELERIGYLGEVEPTYKATPMAAHFELHIEQGPVLETEQRKIGIVQGAQAKRWFTVEVVGQDTHTGTTPLHMRADALLTASKMLLHSHRVATKHNAYVSTGILNLEPGSTNTVPGIVRFSLDIRSPQDSVVEAVEQELRTSFAAIASGEEVFNLNEGCTPGRPCTVTFKPDIATAAIHFHPDCISCVRDSAADLFGADADKLTKDLVSGAGHDSCYTSMRCPTSMIFVPSRDGLSHNPREFTKDEDCVLGAQVLLGSVLRYDRLRWDRANKK